LNSQLITGPIWKGSSNLANFLEVDLWTSLWIAKVLAPPMEEIETFPLGRDRILYSMDLCVLVIQHGRVEVSNRNLAVPGLMHWHQEICFPYSKKKS
jgi:hypothetical protein